MGITSNRFLHLFIVLNSKTVLVRSQFIAFALSRGGEARRTHGLSLPQAIIPVPLYHFRQWYRGYNQADLLANWLSSWCHVPNCNHVVKRIKHTHTQRGLTAKDRRQNLKNAFAVNTKNLFLMNALLWWMM